MLGVHVLRVVRMRALAAGAAAAFFLGAVPAAPAGGDFVDLASGRGDLWLVGPGGVHRLDPATGRTRWTPRVGAAYPLSVALSPGAVWIAGVDNGSVGGTLTRIDLRSRSGRVVWRRPLGGVLYVAAGGASVWALVAQGAATGVARFSASGRLERFWRLPAAGRMAADAAGCWISTGRFLLHIDAAGRVRHVLRGDLGDVATGDGAVWLPQATSVLRVNEGTGRITTLPTGPLGLGGFQHDVAVGAGAVWALDDRHARRSTLLRLEPATGRVTGRVALPGLADSVTVRPDAVWVATVIAPRNRPATGYRVARFDPRTLRRIVVVTLD
jgi:hypothetical protein